jgi:hypothetical protein
MGSLLRKEAAELEPYMSRAHPRRPNVTSGCLVFLSSARKMLIIILHELCVHKEELLPALVEGRFALLWLTPVSALPLDQPRPFYSSVIFAGLLDRSN